MRIDQTLFPNGDEHPELPTRFVVAMEGVKPGENCKKILEPGNCGRKSSHFSEGLKPPV